MPWHGARFDPQQGQEDNPEQGVVHSEGVRDGGALGEGAFEYHRSERKNERGEKWPEQIHAVRANSLTASRPAHNAGATSPLRGKSLSGNR